MQMTRRGLLLAAVGGTIAVASGIGGSAYIRHRRGAWRRLNTDPSVFLHIMPDHQVEVLIKHLEMGQGIMTGLTSLVAEELDADWSQMRAALAPGNQDLFKNGLYGRQATAASSSIHNAYLQMRQIGAAARHMLLQAAAKELGVNAGDLEIEDGVIASVSGDRLRFGDVADAAMAERVPDAATLTLKPASAFKLIGQDLPRVDGPEKVTGQAVFSLDVRRPNMIRAVVARPPLFGGKVARYDATHALAVDGVLQVVKIPSGVAVLAEDSWAAIKGREALDVTWDDSDAEQRSTPEMLEEYSKAAKGEGLVALKAGNAAAGLESAEIIREFTHTVPFLAHAPLETLNATIERDGKGFRIFAGCQLHTLDQWAAADVLGVDRDAVFIETPFTGSSFGRRAYSRSDWIVELAEIAKASTLDRPIQVFWTREDDLAGGVYRPMALHTARVGIDSSGQITGWDHHIVCKSLMAGTPWEIYLLENGTDRGSVGAVTEQPYTLPNFQVLSHNIETPIPVGFWRSISDSHGLFATETIMDQMAAAAGLDPIEFRHKHLAPTATRERAVLNHVAKMANWSDGKRALGVALTKDHLIGKTTHVAMIAEVEVKVGAIKVPQIYVAVDCGLAINPNIIRTQVESSVAFAFSTVFRNEITLADGIVEQSNFDGFEPTRMSEMPKVFVGILPSDAAPSGIGEAAVAPVAPAIANAVFKATGTLHHTLPFRGVS